MNTFQGYHDECGVFGIFQHSEAAHIVYLGLFGLQHRGQESAGIVTASHENLFSHRGMGYVADVFNKTILNRLKGAHAIGHVRYSTQGDSHLKNAQPVVASCWRGPLAISHNGNLVNALDLRRELERNGSIFQTTNDSEVIMHLVANTPQSELEDALYETLHSIRGAYSLLILAPDRLIAVRDPNGFRPLVLGRLEKSPVLSSETCALDLIGAEYVRDIQPGEMLIISAGETTSVLYSNQSEPAFCIFELIYFSRPDSIINGHSVYEMRKIMGQRLAEEHPVDADIVIPVPDSGIGAAIGYAEKSRLPFEIGLIRNHYVGRTFIEPKQAIRDFGVKLKLNPVRSLLANRRVVVVDDSIVRGTTSRKLVRMLREAGVREVHVRISSPPTIGPCRYGIDTPDKKELIANRMPIEEIAAYIGADSLGYLSLEGLRSSVSGGRYCTACFDNRYPVELTPFKRLQRNLFESE